MRHSLCSLPSFCNRFIVVLSSHSALSLEHRRPCRSLDAYVEHRPDKRRWRAPQTHREPGSSLATMAPPFLSPGLVAAPLSPRRTAVDAPRFVCGARPSPRAAAPTTWSRRRPVAIRRQSGSQPNGRPVGDVCPIARPATRRGGDWGAAAGGAPGRLPYAAGRAGRVMTYTA